jgi:hypothetical protein
MPTSLSLLAYRIGLVCFGRPANTYRMLRMPRFLFTRDAGPRSVEQQAESTLHVFDRNVVEKMVSGVDLE